MPSPQPDPAGTAPAAAMPADAAPAAAMPADAAPAAAMPADAAPAGAAPAGAASADAVPADTVPAGAVPVAALPADAVPADAAPVALLLAAGAGRRLGLGPKALLSYRGRPLVEHAVSVLRAGGCARVLVVLGAAADEVAARAELSGCAVVRNPGWESGMGSSLRVGLAALPPDAPAALVSLVDTPGVTAGAVARLLDAHRRGSALAAAAYRGSRGHPVLIGAEHWAEASAGAVGDSGARTLLRAHAAELELVECGDIGVPDDIDTPQAWAAWQAQDRASTD
jgi:CTP:molybdopterin cytidylyltransferase MocA